MINDLVNNAFYPSNQSPYFKVCQNSTSLPAISYTDDEELCWRTIFKRLKMLWPTYACSRFQQGLEILEKAGIVKENQIPDLQQVSDFLESKTGFILKPASGLCSARDFLSSLAMKAFPCTLYMRHHSAPGYSPEPDLVHEIIGHVPLLVKNPFIFALKILKSFWTTSLNSHKKLASQV